MCFSSQATQPSDLTEINAYCNARGMTSGSIGEYKYLVAWRINDNIQLYDKSRNKMWQRVWTMESIMLAVPDIQHISKLFNGLL